MGTTNETLGDFVLVRPVQPDSLDFVRGYEAVQQKPPLTPLLIEGPPDPDFMTGNYGTAGIWNLNTAGAGAAGSSATNGVDTTERCCGVLALATGTTNGVQPTPAGGYAAIRLAAGGILLGLAEVQTIWRAAVSALSTVGEEYIVAFGLHDAVATGTRDAVDGVFFFYDRLANGDFWCCRSVSNTGTVVTTVTTVPVVAGVFSVFETWVAADGSRTRFLIDGVQVASHTGGAIPTGAGRQTGLGAMIAKTAGATSRSLYLDSCHYRIAYTAER